MSAIPVEQIEVQPRRDRRSAIHPRPFDKRDLCRRGSPLLHVRRLHMRVMLARCQVRRHRPGQGENHLGAQVQICCGTTSEPHSHVQSPHVKQRTSNAGTNPVCSNGTGMYCRPSVSSRLDSICSTGIATSCHLQSACSNLQRD